MHVRLNENDIQNLLKTVGFHQKYSDIKTPAPGCAVLVGGIYFCDITNTGKQLCSPNEPFVVVLEKGFFFLNEISSFGVDFEICNFLDLFMPKHTHYTLTKIQKVKKPIMIARQACKNNTYFMAETVHFDLEVNAKCINVNAFMRLMHSDMAISSFDILQLHSILFVLCKHC